MIKKADENKVNNIQMVSVDELVSKDHLVRKIDNVIDFNFIYPLVEDLYSDIGRKSIDPVVLFKIIFIQFLFNIKSMRQTIKEIENNIAYRWFLGYDFYSKVPHHSTFGKNYVRRFEDTEIFRKIFDHILDQAVKGGLVKLDNIFIDSTHIKASANKHKVTKEMVEKTFDNYTQKYHDEINKIRVEEGKEPINFKKQKLTNVSTTDPECGMFHKGEKERQLAYSNQVACDENGWVIDSKVVAGNINDNKSGVDFITNLAKQNDISTTVIDAGYTSPILIDAIVQNGVVPVTPYTRPRGKKKLGIKKSQFLYDEENDKYICLNGKELLYKGIDINGYLTYRSKSIDCKKCPLKNDCTKQSNKTITRHLLEYTRKYIKEIRLSDLGKELYPKRKFTIERVFAQCKREHSLGFTQLRGLNKNEDRSLIIFAMHNLKKLALLNTSGADDSCIVNTLWRNILLFLFKYSKKRKKGHSF